MAQGTLLKILQLPKLGNNLEKMYMKRMGFPDGLDFTV